MDTCSQNTHMQQKGTAGFALEETEVSTLVREVLECASLTEALVIGMETLLAKAGNANTHRGMQLVTTQEIRRIHVAIRDGWIAEGKSLEDFQPNFMPINPPAPAPRRTSHAEADPGYDTRLGRWE